MSPTKKQRRWIFQDHPWPRKCRLPFEGATFLYLIVSNRCKKVKSQLPRRISFSVKISGNFSSGQICNVWIMICRSTGTLLGLIVLPCFVIKRQFIQEQLGMLQIHGSPSATPSYTPISRDLFFFAAIWGEFCEDFQEFFTIHNLH